MTPFATSRPPALRPRGVVLAATVAAALVACVLVGRPAAADVTVEGKVVFVADGDTFDVDVFGDGTSTPMRVRSIGVNAMEQSVYSQDLSRIRGDCHSTEATRRLHGLIHGKTVRLSSRFYGSKSGGRYRRSADVRLDGVWRDVHLILMKEGHALFLGNHTEYRKNKAYLAAAQQAKRAGRNLWDPDYCGTGPAADLALSLRYDAPGSDASNLNGEYVKVTNRGSSTVPLAGWHVRDGSAATYRFPSTAAVGPGRSVYVHVGSGTNGNGHFYWGLRSPLLDNVTGYPTYVGDGGYLFDPRGNLRSSFMYPCRYACPPSPLKGKIAVSRIVANPDGTDTANREYVVVRNTSAGKVNLAEQTVAVGAVRYMFRPGTVLAPREGVRLSMGKGSPTRLRQYAGRSRPTLANSGGRVRVLAPDSTLIVCRAWGSGRC